MRLVSDFSQLQKTVLGASPRYRVVAFDVFNTLLVRRVEGEFLKAAVAARLVELLTPLVHPGFLPSAAVAAERRLELEQAIASERVARGEDNEVDYTELVTRWIRTWLPDRYDWVATALREDELQLEERALRAAPGIFELLTALHATGQRLVVVSDMYHRGVDIERLLAKCRLAQFFSAFYVSNDAGLRKATGRIFPWVLAKEGVTAKEMLFVGDDHLADNVQPNKLGIDSVHVVDMPELERRERLQTLDSLAKRNHAWACELTQEVIAQGSTRVRKDGGPDYATGLCLAPGLVAFVMDTVERARRAGIRRIFFLAREGLTFLRIYGALRRAGALGPEPVPEARYLCLSRASTILPAMKGLAWEDLSRFWRSYPRQSLSQLLKNLSLPAEEFLPLAAAVGFTDVDRPIEDPLTDGPLIAFLGSRDVHAAFIRRRDEARQLLREYLAWRGMWGEPRAALLDVGWKGSMQDNLARAFAGTEGFPQLDGYYLGVADPGEAGPHSLKHGFLADGRRGDLEESDFFRNTAIYEMVTQANHGSTIGYERSPHHPPAILPVLKQHDIERENARRFFVPAQKAIDDWTADFVDAWPLLRFSARDLKPGALAQALRYIRYPTRSEADAFLRYSHVESFGVHNITRFGFDVRLRDLIGPPGRVVRDLQRRFEFTLWREGVVGRSRIPFAPVLYDAWTTLNRIW